ncbi:hypothetical protein KQX54_010113 [Cotesia glomerata]|uniref:BEN domain-containing protein n=1 Tax=Cotesia glomerata TaxID=32391 RepID=A0AAV7IFZ2_COTGL|nr:hypothetical protein KQX54_010113 [Cotesia glomerata]
MSKKYALVYWIESKTIQTSESAKIPVASRYDGATVRLKSQDNKNKSKYHDARIVRIRNDVTELDELEVDEETGQVIDRSQKVFSKKVLASKVLLKEEKKESEKRKNSVEKMREDNILKSKSFLTEEPKSKRSKSSKSPKDGTSLKNGSNKRGRPKNTSSEIPSTSSANTDAKIQKTQITEISLSSDAIDIGARDNEETIMDQEEIIDNISPKNVCFIPGGFYTRDFGFSQVSSSSMKYSLDPGRQNLLTKITKVEIFPNTGCYLPKSIMTSIDVLNLQEDDWKKYVTNILVQMFGDKLKFMSVKGYRGNIALHSKIQRALFNLINDKADPQISLQAFNLAINKACTNRKTSSAKVSIIVNHKKEDDDDKDDDDEDEQNFNRSLTNLKNYDDLPRFVSSSQVLSSAVSRTSSPVMVEEKEKNEEFLEDTYQNDRTNNLPPTDLDSSLHLDRSQATLLDTNNSMFPPSTNETTVEVDIPLRNSSHEQSTITLICSKSIVQHQPAVESRRLDRRRTLAVVMS